MSKLSWYSHRLQAMSPVEMASHASRKWRQVVDACYQPRLAKPLGLPTAFPSLPCPTVAPPLVRRALHRDAERILAGCWTVFGHLDLPVADPPRWHKDYLSGTDLRTNAPALALNYRELPAGTDIKLIWELSRWHHLVRLAMAAYVLGHERAAHKCIQWLGDWTRHNPAYRGWNWTSALEAGMRLIQFTWIDALLEASACVGSLPEPSVDGVPVTKALARLREQILPQHVAHTWRHRSFGSSANNHLLGELTGLILAIVRWPALVVSAGSLEDLQQRWEREVLTQFAPDGGNHEQALGYHLFSWELCWHARAALASAGRAIAPAVDDRLRRGAQFYVAVHGERESWDYGDSDNGTVTPFYAEQTRAAGEWHEWLLTPAQSTAINYWQGGERARCDMDMAGPQSSYGRWSRYEESGYAVWRDFRWMLRWDLSRLGYLTTAAHGHADALHLSLWLDGVAIIVDPGTGCYFADPALRSWLASRPAHNAPTPLTSDSSPRRLGLFLWDAHHEKPSCSSAGALGLQASLQYPSGLVQRTVQLSSDHLRWDVEDSYGSESPQAFAVRWQFPPGANLEHVTPRSLRVRRGGVSIDIELSEDWAAVYPVVERHETGAPVLAGQPEAEYAGTTSPTFRRVEWGPYLQLVARPGTRNSLFRTSFAVSSHL
jgi:hypothetical protein